MPLASPSGDPPPPGLAGVGRPDQASLVAVLDGLTDAVHLYDRAWRWLYMNPAAVRRLKELGQDPEALLGKVVWDVFPLAPSVREASEKALMGGGEEAVIVPGQGPERAWYEIRIVPVEGGVVTFARDVTERHRAEERQRIMAEASAILAASLDAEATLQALADLTVGRMADYALTYVLDERAGEVRRVGAASNRHPEELERLVGRTIPLDSDHGVAEVVRSGRSKLARSISEEDLLRTPLDEEQRSILRRMSPVSAIIVPLQARGRTLGAFVAATVDGGCAPYDEADQALMEELAMRAAFAYDNARLFEKAQAASRAKSQFLATVSHELRTPLTAVLGYADLLDAGLSGPLTEPQRGQVGRIMMSARHLVGVIEQILIFSRAEAGREGVRLEDVDLAEIMEDTAALLEPQATDKGILIERRLAKGEAQLRTDPGKVRQILLNLAGNALKFTEKGHVILELARDDDGVLIRVRDTGPGIERQQLERIFEPFTQVHETDTRPYGGTGLGLAVSRRLARLLGGDVTVESVVDEGSTFTLRLPATPPATEA